MNPMGIDFIPHYFRQAKFYTFHFCCWPRQISKKKQKNINFFPKAKKKPFWRTSTLNQKKTQRFQRCPKKMEPTLGHGGGLCQHDWTSTNFLEAAPDSLPALPALPAAVETPQKAVRVGSWVFFSKIRWIPKNGALVQMIFGWFLGSSR